jgi:hypothetical protein
MKQRVPLLRIAALSILCVPLLSSCLLLFLPSQPSEPEAPAPGSIMTMLTIDNPGDAGSISLDGAVLAFDSYSYTIKHLSDGSERHEILFSAASGYSFDYFTVTEGGLSSSVYSNPMVIDLKKTSVTIHVVASSDGS